MKLKSILALTTACIMTMAVFAGCTKKDKDNDASTPSSQPPQSEAPAKVASGMLEDVHKGVTDLFGESYIPQAVDDVVLAEMYGVDKSLVKDFFADAPLMNVHVDTFIGIEAVEGKAEEVEKALNAYREKFIKDKTDFPYLADHLPKAEAAQVVRVDDYVFYVMLADTADVAEDKLESEIKTQIQKAVDTIKSTLK